MSYNYNGGDDLSWYNSQQVSLPIAASTSNDVTEGVKATTSTDTSSTNPTPTEFQAEWPYGNSQLVERSSQGWYSTSDSHQHTHSSTLPPQMTRSPRQYSSNTNNFDAQGNGGLPNMIRLGIYSIPDEILYNPDLQITFGSGNSSISQQDTPIGEFLDEYNMDARTTGFGTPVPSRYQANNNLSAGSDTFADLESSIQDENFPLGAPTPGEQYQAGFSNGSMTAHLNRPLSAPPAGNWVLEPGLSYTTTRLDKPLPLSPLPRVMPKTVPLAHSGDWQYGGSSIGPAIDSDVSVLQPSNNIRNDPSGTLGQDTGAIQGAQPLEQFSQNDGLGQNTSANIPVLRQQSDVLSTRSPLRSDRRRHSDPVSIPVHDARESQQGVQVPSQLSEQATQHQTSSINASRALQLSGALIKDALGGMSSRRLSETSPVPAQELYDTNPPPAGVRTESWQRSQNRAASQSGRTLQQSHGPPVTFPESHGRFSDVEPQTTLIYSEHSHQNTSRQPTKQCESASFTSGSARLTETARPQLRLVAPAPLAVTPQQPTRRDRQLRQPGRQFAQSGTPSTQQNQRVPHRGPPRVQTSQQQILPRTRFDRMLPSRLDPKAAAFANVEPAEDFMKMVSKMPFLDRVACVDRLMREDLFRDYMKPNLFREYTTGHENGLKMALERRIKGPLHGIIENTEIRHERQSLKWKANFDDKQIENERRKRELAAHTIAGSMTTDTSEDLGMTRAGSKRRHQTLASAQDSHYEIDDEVVESDDGSDNNSIVHPRNSPKKPRTSGPTSSGPTPSDITNKFCSNAVENVPFLPDPIHSQLCNLSIEQLIIPVQEYIAQNGEIADTNVEHWRACAGQAAGTEMEQEMTCTHCADHMQDGSVPFASCVVIGATIPAGEHFKGACMNCVYLGKDQDCSLRRVESEETEAQ